MEGVDKRDYNIPEHIQCGSGKELKTCQMQCLLEKCKWSPLCPPKTPNLGKFDFWSQFQHCDSSFTLQICSVSSRLSLSRTISESYMSHQWVFYRNQRRFFQSLSKICRAAREALLVVLTSNCNCSELPEIPSEEQRDHLRSKSKRFIMQSLCRLNALIPPCNHWY